MEFQLDPHAAHLVVEKFDVFPSELPLADNKATEIAADPKNELDKKFSIGDAPEWADKISEEDLINFSKESDTNKDIKATGKGLCYFYNRTINTSNDRTEDFINMVWDLSNPDILQGASIREVTVGKDQSMILHRVAVVRGGAIVDKRNDLNVRVLDNDPSSARGTINKIKKVNVIINDLHIEDIFVYEYSLVTIFSQEAFLDKKYFKTLLSLPTGYWTYKNYVFNLIQNRDEKIKIAKKYFRDAQGARLSDEVIFLEKRGHYQFKQENFLGETRADRFSPYLEVATDSTWEEISDYLFSFYKERLADLRIKNSELYRTLELSGTADHRSSDMRKVIEYVQDEIVYLYDAEVMHEYIPQPSIATLYTKSGDCKAKSLLLVNLLDTLGIKSEIILVNYDYDYFISDSLPSPFIFNHVIVKIDWNGRDWFVDPTWANRKGILEKRAQPLFSKFLPIREMSSLVSKEFSADLNSLNIVENINIDLIKEDATVTNTSAYLKESADIVRANFKKLTMRDNLNGKNVWLYNALRLGKEKKIDDVVKNAEYKIVLDDQENNMISTSYTCTLLSPYTQITPAKAFKFYYNIDIDRIENFDHKDRLCASFLGFPRKYVLTITSDRFIKASEAVTKRELKIDNCYFTFANTKLITQKSITVNSSYLPKTYGYVQSADLQGMKTDLLKVGDSNFGVGVVFVTGIQYISQKWWFNLLMYIIAYIVIAELISKL